MEQKKNTRKLWVALFALYIADRLPKNHMWTKSRCASWEYLIRNASASLAVFFINCRIIYVLSHAVSQTHFSLFDSKLCDLVKLFTNLAEGMKTCRISYDFIPANVTSPLLIPVRFPIRIFPASCILAETCGSLWSRFLTELYEKVRPVSLGSLASSPSRDKVRYAPIVVLHNYPCVSTQLERFWQIPWISLSVWVCSKCTNSRFSFSSIETKSQTC